MVHGDTNEVILLFFFYEQLPNFKHNTLWILSYFGVTEREIYVQCLKSQYPFVLLLNN